MESFPIPLEALNHHSGVPLHEQLVSLVQAAIVAGRLRVGDQLPAEQQLAMAVGVARGTVRQSLFRLEQAGLIERRHGRGTFVLGAATHDHPAAAGAVASVQARYLAALLAGDGDAALAALLAALQEGLTVETLVEEVLRPAAYRVGTHWQTGQINVAVEHRASATIARDLTDLHRRAPRLPAVGCTLVIGCIEGEQHTLGCRMVADAFERAGWTVHYLGADVPLAAMVALARAVAADLVGVSVTMPAYLPRVADLVAALHADTDPAPPVLVGGQPVIDNETLVRSVGAWATAASPAAAVQLANAVLRERTTAEPASSSTTSSHRPPV